MGKTNAAIDFDMPSLSAAPALIEPAAFPEMGKIDISGGERIVGYAMEGWGKTSMVAHAQGKVGLIMLGNETGYITLRRHNRVPEVDAAIATEWLGLLGLVRNIAKQGKKYDILALDTVGGAERICHEYVCATEFDGDWGEKGFQGFQRGADVSIKEWLHLINALHEIADNGTTVVLLGHVFIRPHNDPVDPVYDKFKCAVHHKTWATINQWADSVLFGKFLSDVQKEKGALRAKGTGGRARVMHTVGCDAWDAKNRYGMPETIIMPDDPSKTWGEVAKYINLKGN